MSALDEIRDRLSVITRGPWKAWDRGIGFEVQDQHDEPINSGFRETFSRRDAEFVAAAPTDVKILLAAVEAVTALHKPEKRWMLSEDDDRSWDSEADAREWMDGDEPERELPFFEVCAECKRVEEGPCDGECILELGYRQCMWPCSTYKALTAALEGKL